MSGAVFTLGNSVSGSLSLGSALSKFGRVAGQAGFTIEQDEETLNNTVTSRYAGLAAVTVSGVTSVLNPSLVLIPSAYNTSGSTGILYSLHSKPNGVADFVVTRATEGTRFNSIGRISTVGSGDARLDYLTSGGTVGPPALLVEPSAQNFVLNSQNTATDWTIGANTASGYVDVIGVSGNTVTASASGGIGGSVFVRRSLNTALASGSTYTVSFLMRQTGAHTIGGYWIGIAGVGDIGGGFDVSGSFSSGAIYSAAGATNRIRRVERWGTDVYRCSETFTLTASGTLDRMLMGPVAAVNSTASVASGTQMSFAAPQIELGAVPTTFIPTTTAAVTRAADVISVTGAVSGCIGQTEGTVYIEVDYRNFANITMLSVQTAGIASGAVRIENTTNGTQLRCHVRDVSGTAIMDQIITSPLLSTGINKIAVGYSSAANGLCIALNGTVVFTGTATSAFTINPDRIMLGSREVSSTPQLFFNNRIRAAAVYSTRLTDAQLSALTTI